LRIDQAPFDVLLGHVRKTLRLSGRTVVWAQTQHDKRNQMNSSGLSSLIWFFAIIAMIPVALRLLKRTHMGGTTAPAVMRSIAVLQISQNQKLVTVEVGTGEERRWLVLGVTPQQISTLHTMAPQDDAISIPVRAIPPMPFAQLLDKLRQYKGSARDR
jgi:flagellar protein FliO/FliZ